MCSDEERLIRRIQCQNSRAKKAGLIGDLTVEQWKNCCDYFANKCAYCDKSAPLEIEHFNSLVNSGATTVGNILPACSACNNAKNGINLKWFWSRLPEDRKLLIYQYLLKYNTNEYLEALLK